MEPEGGGQCPQSRGNALRPCPQAWDIPSLRAIFAVELLCRFTASSPPSYTVAAWHTALLPSLWRQLPSTKKRSSGVHRSAQEHGARPLRRFVSVGRLNRSVHIFGKLQIGEISHIVCSFFSGRDRVLLPSTPGEGTHHHFLGS